MTDIRRNDIDADQRHDDLVDIAKVILAVADELQKLREAVDSAVGAIRELQR